MKQKRGEKIPPPTEINFWLWSWLLHELLMTFSRAMSGVSHISVTLFCPLVTVGHVTTQRRYLSDDIFSSFYVKLLANRQINRQTPDITSPLWEGSNNKGQCTDYYDIILWHTNNKGKIKPNIWVVWYSKDRPVARVHWMACHSRWRG